MKKFYTLFIVILVVAAVAGFAQDKGVFWNGTRLVTFANAGTNTNVVIFVQIDIGWNSYTANVTIGTASAVIYMDPYTNGQIVTLPSASSMTNKMLWVKNTGTNYSFTLDADGSEEIDDATNQTIDAAEAYTIHSDGSQWWIQ